MGYESVLLLGVCTGSRTLTPIAVVSWFAYKHTGTGSPALALTGWRSFIGNPISVGVFTLMALGEYVGDKLPNTPSRKSAVGLAGRTAFGTAAGVILAPKVGGNAVIAGLAGATGALLGTFGGWWVRTELAKRVGKDWPVAVVEDCVTIAASILLLNAVTRTDLVP